MKPCDKGAGIIICNFEDYLKSCKDHLMSTVTTESPDTYYKAITETELVQAKKEIDSVLRNAFNREEISKKCLASFHCRYPSI